VYVVVEYEILLPNEMDGGRVMDQVMSLFKLHVLPYVPYYNVVVVVVVSSR